ncbi:MAG: tRNA epoxyqueuosine(34) reductase QueG [Spirochaetia bacterium]|nr:tRNA epoxyqueuosine(34) reductase QueG [Spirochaetia bacterium]
MKETIRKIALGWGFSLAGFCEVQISNEDIKNLNAFENNLNGELDWFRRYQGIRTDPKQIMPRSMSVLVLAAPYMNQGYSRKIEASHYKISRYAAGRDYHKVIKKKCQKVLNQIQELFPEIQGRVTVDSAPVPEKIFAVNSGISWRGKNTNCIHPDLGSYFFLSCIFLNVKIPADDAMKDRCGTCRKCIESCPTGALGEYTIDAGKCISYLTIEKKERIPDPFRSQLHGWIFGCDICQEVCPYNQRDRIYDASVPSDFLPRERLISFLDQLNSRNEDSPEDLAGYSEEEFEVVLSGSPLRRAGMKKILDNISAAGQTL